MVALKRVASVNDDSLPENCDPNFEFRYVDISAVGDGRLVAEPETLVFSAAPSRARRLTRSGDILVSTVRTYLRAVCPVDDDVEAPYLRVANVQHGRLDLRTVTRVRVPRSLAERSTLRPGDVLMTEGGDIDKLGRGTVWDGAIPGCLHQNHVFAVRAAGGLNPKFLAHFTRTSSARAHFESTGVHSTNLASTSASKVKDLPFPVVSSAFQERMVDGLETCLARSASVARKIRESITLLTERKQALITAAVTGKLDMARNIAEEAS